MPTVAQLVVESFPCLKGQRLGGKMKHHTPAALQVGWGQSQAREGTPEEIKHDEPQV